MGCEVGSIDIVGSPVGEEEGRNVGEVVYEMLKAFSETFWPRAKVLRRVHAHVTLVVV